MIRALFFALIISAQAQAQAQSPCEAGLHKPARRFLRTLRSAVVTGDVTADHLRWMVEQPEPADPTGWRDLQVGNLAFRNSFRREIPQIDTAQWKLLVTQAQQIEVKKKTEQVQVAQAQASTEYIPAVLPDFTFPTGEKVTEYFISSKGELFVATENGNNVFIYNFMTGAKFPLGRDPQFRRAGDFFESSKGEVFYTLVTNSLLTANNARTQEPILNVEIEEKHNTAVHSVPLMYEEKGELNVLFVSESSRNAKPIVRKVSVKEQKFVSVADLTHSTAIRRDDGHVYVSTTVVGQNVMKAEKVIRDLTLGREVTRFKGTLTEVQRTGLFLVYRKPLFFIDPDDSANTLFEHEGKTFSAKTDVVNGLIIREMPDGPPRILDIDFQYRAQRTESLQTKDGAVLAVWEGTVEGYKQMNLHFVTSGINFKFFSPPFINIKGVFQTPKDGRYMMLAQELGRPWQLLQVYGPERTGML